jgi:hypothetical protein
MAFRKEENNLSDNCLLLQRKADRITTEILISDLPFIDICIAVNKLRDWVDDRMPEKRSLFEMIYISRYNRLWQQFRNADETF